MRTLIALFCLILVAGVARAQPIFVVDPDHTFGGYIGGTLRVGSLFRQPAFLTGATTAIVIDRRLMIGLEGTALSGDVVIHPTSETRASLRLLYGGVTVAYAFASSRPVHPVVRATVGGGGVRALGEVPMQSRAPMILVLMIDVPVDGPDDAFFLVEPGLGIEATIGPHVRVELAALYRIVAGIGVPGLDDGSISGASLALTARLGLW